MPTELRSLEQTLSESIDWNQARIKFLARFLIALICVKTVCLSQIASVFAGQAQSASHYKRIQRFLRGFDLDYAALARLVAALSGVKAPWVLSLDRTNWKLGKTQINFLVLALVHQGVAFPLLWSVLEKERQGKAGNSNTAERIALMECFIGALGKDKIAFVTADREFGSGAWIAWLLRQGISFRLRIKSNVLLANGKGEMVRAEGLFRNAALKQEWRLPGKRNCLGAAVFVGGTRLPGDFLIVVSDVEEASLDDYALRWGIETLFGCLKSRGFCLEATHVTEPERVSKLLGLLSLAFCWAFAAGVWLAQVVPCKLKKHGRAAISLFRRGLDWLRRLLVPLCGQKRQADFNKALQFLSCT
jgi:hypothetical protein